MSLFRTKSIDRLIAESEMPGQRLAKTLGPWSLTALGIGAVIGSGIFILTGTAAAGETRAVADILNAPVLDILLHAGHPVSTIGRPGAGPGIALSFFLVAIACSLAALCFAELASMVPIAGSTYTYAYAILGEVVAWIIGWDLILEYAVSNMAVGVGFSAYFNDILDAFFGFHMPKYLSEPMFIGDAATGSWFNLPAFAVVMIVTVLLVRGVKESASANNVMVLVKIAVILIFVFAVSGSVKTSNWVPFMPNGFSGVMTGAAIVFFTYIGFDSVSTAAEECKNAQRDMPFGILMTLLVCTILYVSVALALTGVKDWRLLNSAAPVADVLRELGYDNVRRIVNFGALVGMLSSLLVFQYGQARVWFAMARDRLLPSVFARLHPTYKTPHVSTWVAGIVVGIPAGIWDVGTFADLSNIGTLFAFAVVSAGVIVARKKDPGRHRSFRVPLVPWIPALSILCCFALMLGLPLMTWLRFIAWLAFGLIFYFSFGRRNVNPASL
ncbi:MAG: amino acid permease [Bryobacteraceae bacterium]|nr:amino acid permease [Bryobacteraceae bacterium]